MAPNSLYFPLFFLSVFAQNISTTTSVPPLQWINISNLLQGSSKPPPLKDAAIGYDETSRSLIIFGGVSESGTAQSQTYLLNLQTLSWSIPSPPATLQRGPPSRSAVVSGGDFAASNRHGFVVIGGKGSNGEALSDVWEYDFNNQFWSEVNLSPGGPSPRWGASGGIDPRIPFNQDPVVPGPNNTFYLAGGSDGTIASSLSDIWRLRISGTLSSNLPDSVRASWDRLTIGNLPGRVGQAGAVISQQIISTGGCDSSASLTAINITCARQDTFIVDTQRQVTLSPGSCPVPRIGPVMVPNLNGFSSAFSSQAFLLLGIFNSSLWLDSNGLAQGEVAILDTNTATWSRVLPAGDPDLSGATRFPAPREGAAAVSFPQSLVGGSRTSSADTIVFGGQDANGKLLSDVWILRAYSGVITPSNPIWSGFGDGRLQTGVNADGSGVSVQYLTDCASLVPQSGPPDSSNNGNNLGPTAAPTINEQAFSTSLSHKLLLPLSLVVLLPVILFFRWSPTAYDEQLPKQHVALVPMAMLTGLVAYGLGVAGFALAFTSISSLRASAPAHLKTTHGIAGVVFFLCLYVFVPLLYLVIALLGQKAQINQSSDGDDRRPELITSNEKEDPALLPGRSATPSTYNNSLPSSPRHRTESWDAYVANVFQPNIDGSLPSEYAPPAPRAFEVVNRPNRARKLSGSWPNSLGTGRPVPARRLGDVDWLLRRRSLNAVGELDYVLTQAHNAQAASATANNSSKFHMDLWTAIEYPSRRVITLHICLQLSIAGLSVVALSALWSHTPRYYFIIFLVWILAFYAMVLISAWNRRPTTSILTTTLLRLRGKAHPLPQSNSAPDRTQSSTPNHTHRRPPYRPSTQLGNLSHSPDGTRSLGASDDDENMDEYTRQRIIEEEMANRDVSIVTVPRRKLQIANPS